MATISKRFIARFGLDNSGQSITNLGTSGASLTRSGAHDLTLTTTATTNATIPSGTVTLVDTSTAQTLGTKTLGSSGSDTTTIASQLSANGGVGTAGQVLTSRGANQSPEWTTVTGGGSGGTTTYALTIGTGLSGTSFNGSAAVTIAIDSTVATLTGTQTLTNKTLTSPTLTTPYFNAEAGKATGSFKITGQIETDSYIRSNLQEGTTNGARIELLCSTNSTLAPSGGDYAVVAIDMYEQSLRFYEKGGNNRGLKIDLSACSNSIGSEFATTNTTQTFTNKTLTSPDINGGTADSLTSLSIRDTSAAYDVTIGATSSTTLTANRTLTLDVVNAARTVKLAGNIDIAANFSTATGAVTLTAQSGGSSVTLPSSGTLATLAGTETLSNKTLDGATLGTGGSNTTTIAGQLSANGGVGTSGQVLTSRGANLSPEWTTVSGGGSGVTITDDTSTNATRYLTFTDQTSGSESTLNVASTKLTYNPSTGALSSTDFNSTSDAKLKKNVVPAKGLEVVNKLHGYEFDFIDNGMHASGVIAQEIEEILPHLVKDNIDHKTVAYMQIIPYLIESIKELSQEVNTLKTKLGYK